ncbi:MAG TPA: hypothetical protein VJL59_06100 [Anaerolineales bacterium]|nr:hypothetical protein [Anaerolineales bacterium]
MTTGQTTTSSAQRQRTIYAALGGCGLLAVCACFAGAIGFGIYYFWGKGGTVAGEPSVEYILDASPRMLNPAEGDGGTRLSVAQAILAEIVRPADAATTAGLRVFGAGAVAQPCQDTHLVVPLSASNQGQIADKLFTVSAGSAADSALAEAMVNAIRDLAATQGPHSLVVVTGGADSCNPDAGALIKAEAARAGIKLQTFVVGFKVDAKETEAVKGLVDESTEGTFVNALDQEMLKHTLTAVQDRIDHPETTSVEDVVAAATYQSQTACDHPYLPLRAGATWTYAGDGFGYTWTVDSVSGDLNSATASMTYSFESGSMTYSWYCTSEGVTYFQGGSMSFEGSTVANFTVTDSSGASLLPAGELIPGATWSNAYTMQYSFQAEGVSGDVTTSVTEANTAGPKESMSTGTGTFDVIPVTSNGTYTYTSSFGGAGPTTYSSTSTIYYGYGVGIIRMVSSSSGTSSTTELVSYSVP